MESVEVEGNSIDDAIEKALTTLGVERDRAAIEILSDATRGLLGFGGRKARVRATVRAPITAALASPAPSVSRETIRREAQSPAPMRTDAGLATNIDTASATVRPPRQASPERPESDGDGASPGAGRARTFLLELLNHLGVQCEVISVPTSDGSIVLQIRGQDTGLLIGRRGQTLDAMEYMLNRIVARDGAPGLRVALDVEGYRQRREEHLESLARRLAAKVRESGRPATVDFMSPRDRRIVHLTLEQEAGVASRSQGEGYYRKLLIVPAGRSRGPGRVPGNA